VFVRATRAVSKPPIHENQDVMLILPRYTPAQGLNMYLVRCIFHVNNQGAIYDKYMTDVYEDGLYLDQRADIDLWIDDQKQFPTV